MSGEQFRNTIGYTECVGAIATLLPWEPVSKAATGMLVVLLHVAWLTHRHVNDGKGTPSLLFAGLGMILLTGGKGKLLAGKGSKPDEKEKKEK